MNTAIFFPRLKHGALCGALLLSGFLAGCGKENQPAPPQPAAPAPSANQPPQPAPTPDAPARPAQTPGKKLIATLETTKGLIQFEMFSGDAPKTVENFQALANRGYYKNVIFHRVIKGFMIQGGDPTGTGTGGESAFGPTFNDEISPASPIYQTGYDRGVVAMANRGPNTNGSQFFIMHQRYALPPNYTIFGKVIKGQEVVDAIATAPTEPGDRPVNPVKIVSAKVTEE
jgi:cyclophilin family peptidyl-prolyl cis-trans isomerase